MLYTMRIAPKMSMRSLSIGICCSICSMKILYCGIKRMMMKIPLINWPMERSVIIYQHFFKQFLGLINKLLTCPIFWASVFWFTGNSFSSKCSNRVLRCLNLPFRLTNFFFSVYSFCKFVRSEQYEMKLSIVINAIFLWENSRPQNNFWIYTTLLY